VFKKIKSKFQDIHYNRLKPAAALSFALNIAEFFYKCAINYKNFLYKKGYLKEKEIKDIEVICVGNLTTGGVGKTPITVYFANRISKEKKCAIISRGYGAKLQNKTPNIIKDFDKIYYSDGALCGDEALYCAKNTAKNVMVITSKNRFEALKLAKEKYGCSCAILDDGFSNRTVKKDKIFIALDSKMKFGNEKLLPKGPLRESIEEIKRADTIILVNKGDKDIDNSIHWAKNLAQKYNKKLQLCSLTPKKIYNSQTKAIVKSCEKQNVVAFCAIGQPGQFFDFAEKYYNLAAKISCSDHYTYKKSDIENLKALAKKCNTALFVTTQKDEVKISALIKNETSFSFNVLELGVEIKDID